MAYSFGSIDEMGDGVFRKVCRELGVTAFGVNALVLAPGVVSRLRTSTRSRTSSTSSTADGRGSNSRTESFELGPGGVVHVEAATPRRFTSVGDEDLVLLVVGAKGGYVGRDGRPAEPDAF